MLSPADVAAEKVDPCRAEQSRFIAYSDAGPDLATGQSRSDPIKAPATGARHVASRVGILHRIKVGGLSEECQGVGCGVQLVKVGALRRLSQGGRI